MQPGTVAGALVELHAARASDGERPADNADAETEFFDTSGSGNHSALTTFGFTTASGWAGTGTLADPYRLVFDGASDYVVTPPMTMAGTGYTYELWYSRDAAGTSWQSLIDAGAWGPKTYWLDDGTLLVGVYTHINTQWSATVATGVFPAGMNHWMLVVDNVAMTAQSVMNGVASAHEDLTDAAAMLTAQAVTFGAGCPVSIAVARIYPFALTAPQVARNYAVGYLWPPTKQHHLTDLDDALWQITCGSDAQGWRDVTDECGGLVYSNVRPGGAASCSFTIPGDVAALGYNELRPDSRLKVVYADEVAWDGFILPRGVSYQGE
jgi:hypothetical protein